MRPRFREPMGKIGRFPAATAPTCFFQIFLKDRIIRGRKGAFLGMNKNREFLRRANTRIYKDKRRRFFSFFFFILPSRSHGCKRESVRCITAAVVLIPIKLFGSDTNLAVGRLPYDHDRSPPLRSSLFLPFSSSRPLFLLTHTLYLLLHFMPLLSTP